jgi:CDP-glucose 4,6-dehydratase
LDLNSELWSNKRVLVTGHTGFKGSWLVFWLRQLGADVIGLSLPAPESKPSLYIDAKIATLMSREYFLDIRDEVGVRRIIQELKPDYVFHLAAQAFVYRALMNPNESITTNVVGTSNILLASLSLDSTIGITIATTDKVYQNFGSNEPFRETDVLGGKDPYSASKAAAELVIKSISSTCNPRKIPVTTVRAGNVIGGGDWGENRLVPDLVNAITASKTLLIRNPNATRPWQHILDCLRGYLLIAQSHLEQKIKIPNSINFGPNVSLSVKQVISIFESAFGKKVPYKVLPFNFDEANQLELNSELAFRYLGWQPYNSPEKTISQTALWYSAFIQGNNALDLMSYELLQYKSEEVTQ